MTLLRELTASEFLATHWQKQPLFLQGAVPAALPVLSPDELGWLATQTDVESRLVLTRREGDMLRYHLESGPFDDARLGALPATDWTLLVNDVDKHLPAFRAWFGQAGFVPDWRIDDLMISCAAPGGSVGPHLDQYDVFLCQGQGQREWVTGATGAARVDEANLEMSLLKPFDAASIHAAGTGDVLYLPPGIPHWGIARDLCTTYSIGMRAPTARELCAGAERILGGHASAPDAGDDAPVFYVDPDLAACEAVPGLISTATIRRVREQALLPPELDDLDAARVFGSVVTDPKAWLLADPADPAEVQGLLRHPRTLPVHGMARIAWHDSEQQFLVFVNGVPRAADGSAAGAVRRICETRSATARDIRQLQRQVGGNELLAWMLVEGLFDLETTAG